MMGTASPLNKMNMKNLRYLFLLFWVTACQAPTEEAQDKTHEKIVPTLKTEPVQFDTDDPAIWYNSDDPAQSLVLGTDKEIGGGLYVFDLKGRIIDSLTVRGLSYPNNVDVEYDVALSDSMTTDIAVTVERPLGLVRIFSVPELQPLDGGGIPVFEMESDSLMRLPMGVALYKKPDTGEVHLIVSRKQGPTDGNYLAQYAILPGDSNQLKLELLRQFGQFSGGESEIEAIMVDDALGYVYYSDEMKGVRKYYADPAMGEEELALFGTEDFKEDREGIALWPTSDSTGYIVVSNQQDLSFNVYPRNPENHAHQLLTNWKLSTVETDGCELLAKPLGPDFPNGVFVAMSEDTTFHYYDLRKLGVE